MKRFGVSVLVLILLLGFSSTSYAFNTSWFQDSESGIANLIDIEDTGDYIVMVQIRLRELGYFHFKATGRFQGMTRAATIQFQTHQTNAQGQQIISDGTIGEESAGILFSPSVIRSPIAQSIPIGPRYDEAQTQRGEAVEWASIKAQLNTGSSYKLMDYNTGETFNMVYTGGENHAEMECTTASDTAKFKEVFGAEFNYSKRPMLLSLNSEWIACSLQGEPHGEDAISNNDMAGHACLFFSGSRSHVGTVVDVEHNVNVRRATGQ